MAIGSIDDLFALMRRWEKEFWSAGTGFPPIWYRGESDRHDDLLPAALRPKFRNAVDKADFKPGIGNRPYELREQTINNSFRRMGAALLPHNASLVEIYVLAQHHGLPTRLLDWTTNAMVALFFAVSADPEKDGAIHAMNPRFAIGELPESNPKYSERLQQDIARENDQLLVEAVSFLFGENANRVSDSFVLPINANWRAGRMLQQSSAFTLHVPPAKVSDSEPSLKQTKHLETHVVPASAKQDLLLQLRRARR